MTIYRSLNEITKIQQFIVRYVDYWVHVEGTPIPRQEIIKEMKDRGQSKATVVFSISSLIKTGYLRQSSGLGRNVSYVQLRKL